MISTKRFLTTGEAARVLGVSTTTVIRRFDRGELRGKRHPLTGRRQIQVESLAEFIAAHNLPTAELPHPGRRILVADGDEGEIDKIRSVFASDTSVSIAGVGEGCQVCGRVLSWRPDVVIVNADLPDMSGRDVVRCLRHLPGFDDLLVALSSPPHDEVSRRDMRVLGVDGYLPKPWQPAELTDGITQLLNLHRPVRLQPRPQRNRRKWPRVETDWPAELKVYMGGRSRAYDTGSTRVLNMSRGGALLSDIRLRRGNPVVAPFTLAVRVTGGKGRGLSARCRPVRIESNGDLNLGVEFLGLRSDQSARIAHALSG